MKHDVFISYALQDRSIAEAVFRKLESVRLKCWVGSGDIAAREAWTEAVRDAIASSRVIVLVFSASSDAAPHIEREVAYAFHKGRIIIPFRVGEAVARREILSYLGTIPWSNALNPPAEEDLDTLAARIKALAPPDPAIAAALPPNERKKTVILSSADSWFGALKASHYQSPGILKWVAITTFLCAAILFSWFALRQTTQWVSMAESHGRSLDHGSSLSPTPSTHAGGDALESKQTSAVSHFPLWQAANGSPTPLVQGTQDPPVNPPGARPTNATPSPSRDATPGEQPGELASEPQPRHLPPVTRRVSHSHHPQFPGTQVKEARKIAGLESQRESLQGQRDSLQGQRDSLQGQRDSLQRQLKDVVTNLLATQKTADQVTSQRDELQTRLKESEEKAQIAQKNADLATSQRDQLQTRLNESEERIQIVQKNAEIVARKLADLRTLLKQTENRMLTAQKNEEFVRAQRDLLQTRLRETESEAQAAQEKADLAARQRDALQSEMGELKEKAEQAESSASLAASQRNALEAELAKKEEETPEKKAPSNQPGVDLAELPDSAPDTQFQEVKQKAQSPRVDAKIAQTLPPNPGQNVKPAPLTQALDPFVQPTDPPKN